MASQEKNCYIGVKGKKYGPLSEADILKLFTMKKINGSVKFARPGAKEWIPLSQAGIIPPEMLIDGDGLPPLPPDEDANEIAEAEVEIERKIEEAHAEIDAEAEREMAEIEKMYRVPMWKKIASALGTLGIIAAGIAFYVHYTSSLGVELPFVGGTSPVAASEDIADVFRITNLSFDSLGIGFSLFVENTSVATINAYGASNDFPLFQFNLTLFDEADGIIGSMIGMPPPSNFLPGQTIRISLASPTVFAFGNAVRGELFLREHFMTLTGGATRDHRSDTWVIDLTGSQPVFANAVVNDNAETVEQPPTHADEDLAHVTDELEDTVIVRGDDWLDLGVVHIPPTWDFDFSVDDSPLIVELFSENLLMDVWEIPFGSLDQMIEGRLSMADFNFDDGHIGFVIEYPENTVWVHEESWTAISIWHEGDMSLYQQNKDLLSAIARTLTHFQQMPATAQSTAPTPTPPSTTTPTPIPSNVVANDNWIDLGRVRIPPTWEYDFGGEWSTFILTLQANNTFMDIWDIPGSLDEVWDGSLSVTNFIFDDGEFGYEIVFPDYTIWVHELTWTAITFWHDGNTAFIQQNPDLFRTIARTLTRP